MCGVAGRLAQATSTHSSTETGGEAAADDGEEEGNLSPKTGPVDASEQTEQKVAANGNGNEAENATMVEISFLSTARAGTVIVRESELERAVRALDVHVNLGGH